MLNSPAQTRLWGALTPKRHAQGPLLPDGPPANNNGSNVIDLPGRAPSEPWNWMNWPKGLPTGQENNINGFDFGLRPQPVNQGTPMDAPIGGWIDRGGSTPAADPMSGGGYKYPQGFDPSPGSGQPIEPFDILGKFGANDPILAPVGGGSGFGGAPGLTPWVQQIGPDMSGNSSPLSYPDMSWQLGTQGAETPSGQNYAPPPAAQVDPGGYGGGAYGGMGGFDSPPMDFGGGGGGGYGGGQDPFGGGGMDYGPQPTQDWTDYFGGGGGGNANGPGPKYLLF